MYHCLKTIGFYLLIFYLVVKLWVSIEIYLFFNFQVYLYQAMLTFLNELGSFLSFFVLRNSLREIAVIHSLTVRWILETKGDCPLSACRVLSSPARWHWVGRFCGFQGLLDPGSGFPSLPLICLLVLRFTLFANKYFCLFWVLKHSFNKNLSS